MVLLVKGVSKDNFDIDEKSKSINLNSNGIEYFEKILSNKNLLKMKTYTALKI